MEIFQTSFVLAVPDAERAAQFWVEVLGFELVTVVDGWRFVARGPCRVMLGSCPDDLPPSELGSHSYFGYIVVDSNLDAYHAEIEGRGALIRSPPSDRPWGMREMAVQTPDGHRVMFAEQL